MDGSPRLSLLKKRIAAAGLTIQGEDESAVRQLEKSIGRRDQQRNALRPPDRTPPGLPRSIGTRGTGHRP
jgi:hypothetical protein